MAILSAGPEKVPERRNRGGMDRIADHMAERRLERADGRRAGHRDAQDPRPVDPRMVRAPFCF